MKTLSLLPTPLPTCLFVLGKGGVGRTSTATALAQACAARGERTLIVQWALSDVISPRFLRPSAGHAERELLPGVSVMNFSAEEAMREYFVDHLGMRLLYNVVIENRHVQRLINAAPGVQELFFLGRLFWLVELAGQERGWSYDRIIVDTQATGHGVSLFTIAPTVAGFGMTGPLAAECERVAGMLANPKLVGTLVTTLPEELPVEETLEFIPKLETDLGRPPLAVFVNRSIDVYFPEMETPEVLPPWFVEVSERITGPEARAAALVLYRDLAKRAVFEKQLRDRLGNTAPVLALPDFGLENPYLTQKGLIEAMAAHMREYLGGSGTPSAQASSNPGSGASSRDGRERAAQ